MFSEQIQRKKARDLSSGGGGIMEAKKRDSGWKEELLGLVVKMCLWNSMIMFSSVSLVPAVSLSLSLLYLLLSSLCESLSPL